jgi:nitrate reductase gamma subunit
MLSLVDYSLISYFYLALVVFLVGSAYMIAKMLFLPKGKTDTYLGFPYLHTYPENATFMGMVKNIMKRMFTFSSLKYERDLRVVSLTFHYSLAIAIIVHLNFIYEPTLVSWGIPANTLFTISFWGGLVLGILVVVSGAYLLVRRISDPYLRSFSLLADYFVLFLIMAIALVGSLIRFYVSDSYLYPAVGAFISGLFDGNWTAVPSCAYDLILVHLILISTLLLYFPFSRLVHSFAFFSNPTLTTYFKRE